MSESTQEINEMIQFLAALQATTEAALPELKAIHAKEADPMKRFALSEVILRTEACIDYFNRTEGSDFDLRCN